MALPSRMRRHCDRFREQPAPCYFPLSGRDCGDVAINIFLARGPFSF